MKKTGIYVGVDGCSVGWVSVSIKINKSWKLNVFSTIQEFWNEYSDVQLILIDIPIGLRLIGSDSRLCDKAAREYLTRIRSSSVFPTPCREATYSESYLKANMINRKMTGKGLSKQTWNITNKIREVDILLRENTKARDVIIESHPEVCFTALAKGIPMSNYKKTKKGINQRLKLLNYYWKFPKNPLKLGLNKFKRNQVEVDDLLDAWVLAISASYGRSNLQFLPPNYEYDSEDLPMRMAFPIIK